MSQVKFFKGTSIPTVSNLTEGSIYFNTSNNNIYLNNNNTIITYKAAVGQKDSTTSSGEIFNSYSGTAANIASAAYSHAEGYKTTASKNNAHAEGNSTIASGEHSHAEGYGTKASASQSHAEGYLTVASASAAHAGGISTIANTSAAFAHGDHVTANAHAQAVFGTYNVTDTSALFIIGNGSSGSPGNAFKVMKSGIAYVGNKKVLVEGDIPVNVSAFNNDANYSPVGQKTGVWNAEIFNSSDNTATSDHAHAEGYKTNATGSKAHSEGSVTNAVGEASHAEGGSTKAEGSYSHTEGYGTTTSTLANNGHAEGAGCKVEAAQGHAEGYYTVVSANQAHAEGASTTASGSAAHSEGNKTLAGAYCAHSEGSYSQAIGASSHAEGGHWKVFDATNNVLSMGGEGTIARGHAAHAEGTTTIAEGIASHAQGQFTKAIGDYSYVGGSGITEEIGTLTYDGSTLTVNLVGENTLVSGDYVIIKNSITIGTNNTPLLADATRIIASITNNVVTFTKDFTSEGTFTLEKVIFNTSGNSEICYEDYKEITTLNTYNPGTGIRFPNGEETGTNDGVLQGTGVSIGDKVSLYGVGIGSYTGQTYNLLDQIVTDISPDNYIQLNGTYIFATNAYAVEFGYSIFVSKAIHSVTKYNSAFVHGTGLNATSDNQVVFGKFNEQDDSALFVVGGGTDVNNRKNIFTVKNDSSYINGEKIVTSNVKQIDNSIKITGDINRDYRKYKLIVGAKYPDTNYGTLFGGWEGPDEGMASIFLGINSRVLNSETTGVYYDDIYGVVELRCLPYQGNIVDYIVNQVSPVTASATITLYPPTGLGWVVEDNYNGCRIKSIAIQVSEGNDSCRLSISFTDGTWVETPLVSKTDFYSIMPVSYELLLN